MSFPHIPFREGEAAPGRLEFAQAPAAGRKLPEAGISDAFLCCGSFDTARDHIGEFRIPRAEGAIRRRDARADCYALEGFQAADPARITLFKNGGGAHPDLMTARRILEKWQQRKG